MRAVILTFLFAAASWSQSVGAREVLAPKLVKEIEKQMADSAPPTTALVKSNTAALHQDYAALAGQVKSLSDQLANFTGLIAGFTVKLADKDMSRVQRLEDRLDALDRAKDTGEKRAQADHDALMAWIHPIAAALGAAVIAIISQMVMSKVRDSRHAEQVGEMRSGIEVLKVQTDGVISKLEAAAEARGNLQGHREGVEEEQEFAARTVVHKLGRAVVIETPPAEPPSRKTKRT